MLSKSSLEWPALASLASAQLDSKGEIASALPAKSGNTLDSDSQTSAATAITFDVLWRSRVEQR